MTNFRKRTWFALFVLFALALLLRVNVRQGRVQGPSMEPTYHDGETVLVWKTASLSGLKPGNVIVFRDKNGAELIKRIVFISPAGIERPPAGLYRSRQSGRQIPLEILFAPYLQQLAAGKKPNAPPENTIYVLGDNLLNSDDSRDFGPIGPYQILGKVIP